MVPYLFSLALTLSNKKIIYKELEISFAFSNISKDTMQNIDWSFFGSIEKQMAEIDP